MRIQAEISLYPLRTGNLSKPIGKFSETLKQGDLEIISGTMSTRITGDSENVFSALRSAFLSVANEYEVVMSVKMSNSCPEEIKGNQCL